MSEPILKQDPSILPIQKILDSYVKHKNGTIFQVIPHATKVNMVLLRTKNQYVEKYFNEVKQAIIDGYWSPINVQEFREWAKKDNEYMLKLSHKLVKRILLSQLLIELDEDLERDFENDTYFKNTLSKSTKQCERIIKDQYNKLYEVDKTFLTNFMNNIDDFVGTCSTFDIQDFMHLNKLMEKYAENPKAYQEESVELVKID